MMLFGEMPYIPSSVMEIQTELQSPDFDISRVARILKGEPFIATNVLSMANNIKSNRDPHDRTKIDKVEHAVAYLGKKSTAEVVLTAGVKSLPIKTSVFKSDTFWVESFLVGDIAEYLCEKFQVKFSRDEVYLGASLCNIGKFVLAFFMPDTLDRILERLQSPKQLSTWRAAEEAVGSPDHSILGEIGCAFWGLPLYVSDACRFHHEHSQIRPSGFQGILPGEIIALANQFAHWVLLRPERIDQIHFEKLRVAAGLSKKDMDDLGLSLSKLVKTKRA
jgi:HD-like signal output (HDOD) protein